MSRIKGRETKPEIALKTSLKKRGFDYQPNIYGKPDFINWERKTVIFVDGCFWHGCSLHGTRPKSNRLFWNRKIERNIIRDAEVSKVYTVAGWKVKRIWEHDLEN